MDSSQPIVESSNIPSGTLEDKLRSWNDTFLDYPQHTPLHVLFSDCAGEYPDRVAARHGEDTLSYRRLNERANQLAGFLKDHGVGIGDKVGIALDRSLNMIAGLLAILKAGAAYVPLDLEHPRDRSLFMLQDSGAILLLTSNTSSEQFDAHVKEVFIEDALEKLSWYAKENPPVIIGGNDLAYVLYTSGSTGRPKGVMVEHHNLVNALSGMKTMPGISIDDKVLALTTISFDISGLELFLPLIVGAELVIADADTARDGRALLEMARSEHITFMQATPSTWKMMLNAGWEDKLHMKILSGGEALSRHLADKLLDRCISLFNMYGPTETTIYSTGIQVLPGSEAITIGRPLMNTQVYILDKGLAPLPEGVIGEICIAGEGVARGYLNREELTGQKFVVNPFSDAPGSDRHGPNMHGLDTPADRMYRTGDLGRRMADGRIQYLGREDEQVKIRGNRIELGEIEYHLLRQEGIRELTILMREDRPDDQRLVAYIVPESGSSDKGLLEQADSFSSEQVQGWKRALRKSMPAYMIPGLFVRMDRLPLTPNGKIDKRALPKPMQSGDGGKENKLPSTQMEHLVAGIWIEVLGLVDVSVDDDFFELGGHSLIAVQMMTELEKKTGKRLPMASLFEAPTIAKLSLLLYSEEKSIYWRSLVPIKPYGSKAPLYIVHGSGLTVMIFNSLAKNMDPEQPVYGLQAKGLDEEEEPLDRMEDIAAHYISEILAHNPAGPYYLAGYSLGGIIAFEMARQMKAMGKEVRLVVLFDTYAGDSHSAAHWAVKVLKKIQRQPPKMMFILVSLYKHPGFTIDYQWKYVHRKAKQFLTWTGLIKKKKNDEDEGIFSNRINEALEYANRNYRLSPYDGVIDLLRVDTRFYFIYDPIFLGWRPYATKGVQIREIPGDHKTFLKPPHDKQLAVILQDLINERSGESNGA